MSTDLQFNDANITNYSSIPASLYPVLASVSTSNVTINHQTSPVVNGVVSDGVGVYAKWNYPTTDNLFIRAAVGYQFQVVEGTFAAAQAQSILPPGNIVYETISNFKTNPNPQLHYINLDNGASGRVDIPTGILKGGFNYTVRVRALVFSELGAGTVGGQYFKYTQWGVSSFRVNSIPNALNLRVNGTLNPSAIPNGSPINFSFTFNDVDGPSYFYRIQVGTTPGPSFSANIWDSGLISAGQAFGPREFTVGYSGPALSAGVLYAWRLDVQDGLSDGGFTAAMDTFQINALPVVKSLKINGKETLFGAVPNVAESGAVLSWQFYDSDGDTQRAYSVEVVQIQADPLNPNATQVFEILSTGDIFSTQSSLVLPLLPDGGTIKATIAVRDGIEFGKAFSGSFVANAQPLVQNLLIDGRQNPGDVATTTPVFSWTFFDSSPGDVQSGFRVQVALDSQFSTLLWDTGTISSAANSVQYGNTISPIVAPTPLAHGSYYYVGVQVSDGISFSDFSTGFFAYNTKPNSPTLLSPSAGAFSGPVNISWMPAGTSDPDGDSILYTIEMTNRRSSNQGWQYLAGPFPPTQASFLFDTANVKAGNDYGVRVLANDGFVDSDPALGTSPLNANGLGFTISNHPPVTPVFIQPQAGAVVASVLKVQWLEGNPADVDGDAVFYVLELTRDASVALPIYDRIGVFNEGASQAFVDISTFEDGASYRLRITAFDDKGTPGAVNLSPIFSIVNTPAITDFETLGTTLYMGTSDGRVFRARESIWQLEEDFSSPQSLDVFEQFVRGVPVFESNDGTLSIQSPSGSTFMLRIAKK